MVVRIAFVLLSCLLFTPPLHGQALPPIQLSYASTVFAGDGTLLAYYGSERRVELPSTGSVSKWVIRCLLATEDRDFYNHDGVSLKGLGRAVLETLSGNTQGGSTLTMQLARNLFLTHERSVSRKVKEIELARQLEKKFSKDELLLLYLNTVYFGNGAYGIWAAAREYFQKDPADLNMTQAATLVGLVQAPSRYNPAKHPDRALRRRNEVLHNLVEVKRISKQEFEQARREGLGLNLREETATHFAEYVRREATAILSQQGRSLQNGQYRIFTTLDPTLQKIAERSVSAQWSELPSAMKEAQVGLVTISVGNAAILSMVGGNPASNGRDLNHVSQIRRQPGSSFKPFLYAGLLEEGYTLATPIDDVPIVVDSGMGWEWRPSNDDGSYTGAPVPMIHGIQHSLNLVAAHAMTRLTTPTRVAQFAARCGISSELREYPSLALGTSEVSPLEMAAGFSVFAAGGLRAAPFAISRIEDAQKRVLFRARPDTATVLDSATAFLMTTALQAAVDSGTGRSVRRFYDGPAAGKTGTTQQSTDAWFVGYTPRYATAVWVGFDNPARKLTGAFRYGGGVCAPIWGRMMAAADRVHPPADTTFSTPGEITVMPLCRQSGMLADEDCPETVLCPVNAAMLPGVCNEHGGWLFGW
ncbi:MAG: PBP1A family penicillin-binding protein [Bacteroidia bacterium]|nr:PBP1A family penicillin-binding protein [Bacteroidia bacterium]